jgi:hypothetical protein
VNVVGLFMALLSFAESAPRAYRLKASNAAPPISTSGGTSATGIVADVGDRYTATGPIPSLAVPTSLQASLLADLIDWLPHARSRRSALLLGAPFHMS